MVPVWQTPAKTEMLPIPVTLQRMDVPRDLAKYKVRFKVNFVKKSCATCVLLRAWERTRTEVTEHKYKTKTGTRLEHTGKTIYIQPAKGRVFGVVTMYNNYKLRTTLYGSQTINM